MIIEMTAKFQIVTYRRKKVDCNVIIPVTRLMVLFFFSERHFLPHTHLVIDVYTYLIIDALAKVLGNRLLFVQQSSLDYSILSLSSTNLSRHASSRA